MLGGLGHCPRAKELWMISCCCCLHVKFINLWAEMHGELFLNKALVTQAFLFGCEITGRVFLLQPLRALGFNGRWIRIGFNLQSGSALPPNNRVKRSFEILWPDVDASFLAKNICDGIFFQKRPVSSALNICHLSYSFCSIILWSFAGYSAAVFSSAIAASPVILMFL